MSTISSPIHVFDAGTLVTLEITDDGEIVDLSTATELTIILRKPDGSVLTKTATLTTDGTDGKMQYASVDGDFDQNGSWRVQGHISFGSNHWSTDITKFKVEANLQ